MFDPKILLIYFLLDRKSLFCIFCLLSTKRLFGEVESIIPISSFPFKTSLGYWL